VPACYTSVHSGKLISDLRVARYTKMNKGCSEKGYSRFSWGGWERRRTSPTLCIQSIQRRTHTRTRTHAYTCLHASSLQRKKETPRREIFEEIFPLPEDVCNAS